MSNNKEFEGSVDRHLEKLIDLRNNAISRMFEVKQNKENNIVIEDIAGNDKPLEKLKTNLNFLLFNYWPKRNYTDKFELKEELETKITNGSPEPSADKLDFEECRQLLYKINELMEEIGHTKYETENKGRTTV